MEENQEKLTAEEQETPVTPEDTMPEEEPIGYVPRPAWQVWAARIALVLFLAVVAMYYINLFRGGR